MRMLECAGNGTQGGWEVATMLLNGVVSPDLTFADLQDQGGWRVERWLVENFLRRGTVTVLAGEAGVGKTYLIWSLLISVLRGGRWLNHFECDCGPCFYLGGEGQSDMLMRRHLGLLAGQGIDPEAFKQIEVARLSFRVPRKSPDGHLTVPPHPLSSHQFRRDLLHAAVGVRKEIRNALFVFDPLITMVRNVDNDSEEAGIVMNWCLQLAEECDAAVVLVHHMNKREDVKQRNKIRGESTWTNLAQTAYVLEQSPRDPDVTLIYDNKQRDDPADARAARFAVRKTFEPIMAPVGYFAGAEPGVIKKVSLYFLGRDETEELTSPEDPASRSRAPGPDDDGMSPSYPPGVIPRSTPAAPEAVVESVFDVISSSPKPIAAYSVYNALKAQNLGKSHTVIKRCIALLLEDGRIVQQDSGHRTYYMIAAS